MPSPFPGMDPYLEHPARWPGVHHALIAATAWGLNAILPKQYVADIGERLYVVSTRGIFPDAIVLERTPEAVRPAPVAAPAGGVALPGDPPWVLPAADEEIREGFVQIVAAEDETRVIGIIEILGPTNKSPGHEGRRLYLRKQERVLASEAHLMEVDLLKRGEHTVVPPRERLERIGTWDYLVSLHRAGQGEAYEVWPISLRQRLPRVRLPLADGDPDVVLDLQAVLDRCYDEGGYARRIDYRREPPVPLSPEEAEWVDALLRERGLRD